MNSFLKYFSACLLVLLSQAAFAQTAPVLGNASSFAVLSAAAKGEGAVTCTDSTIAGDVGSSGFPASVTQTNCTITGSVIAPVHPSVLTDFNRAYDALAATYCDENLTGQNLGTLTLSPGVYCFDAATTATGGTLTLAGPADGTWIFKIGTGGTGALTGTNFRVLMPAGAPACNVYWWVAEAATMTDSDFKGTILAGAAITLTGGTFVGRALAKAAVTMTGVAATGCGGTTFNPPHQRCNQGVGNGSESCDPGNSNQGNPSRSNDELGGTPGNPGRKGGNK
jgi:hypothetical protein